MKMADNPYNKEINSARISKDLATRLLQFRQVYQITQAINILNGSKQNDEDLQTLGLRIGAQYNDYMEEKLPAAAGAKLEETFTQYPDLMDLAAAQVDEATPQMSKIELMRQFAARHIVEMTLRKDGWTDKLSEAEATDVNLSLQGTLYTILEKENKKINADDLAARIIKGELDQAEIPMALTALKSAEKKIKEQMKSDWQTYEDMRQPHPVIEEHRTDFENIVYDSKQIRYKPYPELRGVRLCIRDDFNSPDGSKRTFLKIMGALIDTGANIANSSSGSVNGIGKNYDTFVALMKKEYGENVEKIIDTVLLGDKVANATDKERKEAFAKKGTELYCKFLGAVLVKKQETEAQKNNYRFNYTGYIKANVARYIADMKEGLNNITEDLQLADERNLTSLKEMKDDTAEQQIISVHHKIPVASITAVYADMHPELHPADKMQAFTDACRKKYPHLLKEWDYNRNGELDPQMLPPHCGKKVSWICSTCGHSWPATMDQRANGRGCPKCADKQRILSQQKRIVELKGAFADTHPHLVKDWDYSKNEGTPNDYSAGSSYRASWKCHHCGYEWKVSIHKRTKGHKCPKCHQ